MTCPPRKRQDWNLNRDQTPEVCALTPWAVTLEQDAVRHLLADSVSKTKTKPRLEVSGLAAEPVLTRALELLPFVRWPWALVAAPPFCRGRGRQKPGDQDPSRRWFSPCWGLCIPEPG